MSFYPFPAKAFVPLVKIARKLGTSTKLLYPKVLDLSQSTCPFTLSLPKHLYRWWKLLPRTVSQRRFASQQCSFRNLCCVLACVTSGNWSQRSYNVLQTCRNNFAKDIIWCHSGSEWVNGLWKKKWCHSFVQGSCFFVVVLLFLVIKQDRCPCAHSVISTWRQSAAELGNDTTAWLY